MSGLKNDIAAMARGAKKASFIMGQLSSGVKAGAVELPETGEITPSVLEKEEAVGLARVKAVEKACHVPSAFLRFSGSPTRCRR